MIREEGFSSLIEKINSQRKRTIPNRILSIDPGETTGYACFEGINLFHAGQLTIKENGLRTIEFLSQFNAEYVVIEDYRIYPTQLKTHSLSAVFTVQIIGALKFFFEQKDVPITMQMAALPQGFVTDEKIKAWGFWRKSVPHAREAIRHGCYFILFGNY